MDACIDVSSPPNVPQKGVALMVHGYKGFREWGNWKGVAERGRASVGPSMDDFSHNGHCPPFLEDCVDEEALAKTTTSSETKSRVPSH